MGYISYCIIINNQGKDIMWQCIVYNLRECFTLRKYTFSRQQ